MTRAAVILPLMLMFIAGGCNSEDQQLGETPGTGHAASIASVAQSKVGPNGGQAFNFGRIRPHEFQIEVLFDEGTRDLRLFFSRIQSAAPLPVDDLIFELEHEERDLILEANSVPRENETADSASEFRIGGKSLPAEITQREQIHGHLHVTIDGKEYIPDFDLRKR
jgi:hypothetical protein